MGVITPLVGGVAQAFHDDRVVELRVQLAVQEVEGKEDREEQVEVERERRVKGGAPMDHYGDECEKTQDLSQRGVRQDEQVYKSARSASPCCTVPLRSVLSFSDSRILNLYNPSKISSCGIFVMDNRIPSHLESNS